MKEHIAVISGDIIKSQQIKQDNYANMLDVLQTALNDLTKHYPGRYELFRGDSFQVTLSQPEHCIHFAVLLRLQLRKNKFDCRISIGIGEVKYVTDKISLTTGSAFTLSGKQLDSMTTDHLKLITIKQRFNKETSLLIEFADILIKQLTSQQAKALSYYLAQPTLSHQVIAEKMQSSRVNVTKLLGQANYTTLTRFCKQLSQNIEVEFNGC